MSGQSVVAIFVSQSERGQELSQALSTAGMQTAVVASSEELHQSMNRQRIDALIIEQELTGFLSGLDILDRLFQQLLRPATMLIGNLGEQDRVRARSLNVGDVVKWDRGVAEIAKLIQKSMARAEKTISIPEAPRLLVQNADFIRPIPQLVVRLSHYLNNEDATPAQMAKDISTDPKITADLLRMINSSAFGLRNHIVKLADAVTALGIRRTASLIMMSSIQKMQSDFDSRLDAEILKWYRTRSLLTASSAAAFSRLANDISSDHAYTVALLQDLGILVMAHHHRTAYGSILQRVRSIAVLQLETCERQDFSFTHADVSAALLQQWGLPPTMVKFVQDHHDDLDDEGNRSRLETNFLHVMRIGETIANMTDVPSPQRNAQLQPLFNKFPKATPQQIRECLAKAVATTGEMSQLFNVPVPQGNQWKDLLAQAAEELQQGASTARAAG